MADLAVARRSLAAFATEVGYPLTDWQSHSLTLDTRTTVVLAPRQSGKSRCLAALALWWAFRRRKQRVLLVSAGEDASRRLLAEIRRIATGSVLLRGSVVDELAGLLALSNGSEIRSTPASERQIRGWSNDLLLIDEAALVSDDVALGAAYPTTAARPNARIVLASSPWAEGGFFHRHAIAGDSEHVRVHRWSLGDANWISRATIEHARETLPAARFAAEFEGQWSSSLDALFGRELLERIAADVSLPALHELRGPARVLVGCDWGATADRSVVVAWARLPVRQLNPDVELPVFTVATLKVWPAGEPLSDVVSEIAAAPAHWQCVSSELNGIGQQPTQDLIRKLRERPRGTGGGKPGAAVIEARDIDRYVREQLRRQRQTWPGGESPFVTQKRGITTTAELKSQTYGRLRYLADRQQLVIPREADLLRELAALRVELRPGGSVGIEAATGRDDVADAAMLACAPYRQRGSWRSLLTDFAERPVPETRRRSMNQSSLRAGAFGFTAVRRSKV